MSSHPCLMRMDSASYTCCYGNDVYSYQVRCPSSSLIFFPGDIQDEESKMLSILFIINRRIHSPVAKSYTEFSYEQTLQILHSKYPRSKFVRLPLLRSSVFIVRPTSKAEEISLYGEFLDCDGNGNVKDCLRSPCRIRRRQPHGEGAALAFRPHRQLPLPRRRPPSHHPDGVFSRRSRAEPDSGGARCQSLLGQHPETSARDPLAGLRERDAAPVLSDVIAAGAVLPSVLPRESAVLLPSDSLLVHGGPEVQELRGAHAAGPAASVRWHSHMDPFLLARV